MPSQNESMREVSSKSDNKKELKNRGKGLEEGEGVEGAEFGGVEVEFR